MSNVLQKGSIGVQLKISLVDGDNLGLTISNLDTVRIILKSPTGVVKTKSAQIISVSPGIGTYDTVANDLDEVGTWRLQGEYVSADTTIDVKSSITKFKVVDNL